MIEKVTFHIDSLDAMKCYPDPLYFIGDLELLKRQKISIVGTRNPISYTKIYTQEIARKLSSRGVCVVSGGAQGVDGLAHSAAGASNTIMVAGTGLDMRYPQIHSKLIAQIEQDGLVLSQFEAGIPSMKWNFPLRNELVVALGEVLIVAEADLKSGTMHSVKYALKMGKQIYVLPHRLGESEGTQWLLKEGLALPILDIDAFVAQYGAENGTIETDAFLEYCDTHPLYNEAMQKFSNKVIEYECLGLICVENGRIKRK